MLQINLIFFILNYYGNRTINIFVSVFNEFPRWTIKWTKHFKTFFFLWLFLVLAKLFPNKQKMTRKFLKNKHTPSPRQAFVQKLELSFFLEQNSMRKGCVFKTRREEKTFVPLLFFFFFLYYLFQKALNPLSTN